MFQLYKYKIKDIVNDKGIFFWIMFFPLILGTLFFFGFGNLLGGKDIQFDPVNIAVVEEQSNDIFQTVLDEVSKDGENQLFITTKTTYNEAAQLLNDKKVDAIIIVNDSLAMEVKENGISQTIVKTFLNEYISQADVIKNVSITHPENLNKVINSLSEEVSFNENVPLSDSTCDSYAQYFYALIAMCCLFGSMSGLKIVLAMQANLSSLGARREVAPVNKLKVIFADFGAAVTLQCISSILLISYLTFILSIDFGNRLLPIYLISIIGDILGISLGMFIGAIGKGNENIKNGIIISVCLTLCFCSGLMIFNIKNIIEHAFPLFNKINPAALITDALYSINAYDTYTRFTNDVIILLIITFVLFIGSFLMLRRRKFEHL